MAKKLTDKICLYCWKNANHHSIKLWYEHQKHNPILIIVPGKRTKVRYHNYYD